MSSLDPAKNSVYSVSGRRLSVWRVIVALVLIVLLSVGAMLGYQYVSAKATAETAPESWFAGYVDVTATPTFSFETPGSDAARDVLLSFIVADPEEPCNPSWGAAYTLDEAAGALDLDRRIARLQNAGGGVAVSFGGLLNDELATVCTDVDDLVDAYAEVIDRYGVTTIDLDIEASGLTDRVASDRRAEAISRLQTKRRAAGNDLAVWLTLPVAPTGLTRDGTNAVADLLDGDVDLAGVNVMTMDYGESRVAGVSMLDASVAALSATHRQLGILYDRAETPLTDSTLWAKIGATPMVGQNDVLGEVFEIGTASAFAAFAAERGLGRMSMWSLNRDVTCGPNYVNLTIVSDSCSGVEQRGETFAEALSAGFPGRLNSSAGLVTTAEPVSAEDLLDDPATSPYPIWSPEASYLEGSKVVWHRNVYAAKWWTKNELPDNPVLDEWETPWTLVGPVLPGETPQEPLTLPVGTYPEWSGMSVYDRGDRILFDGVPFESKWWNQGESPEAASSSPDSSPWSPLSELEVRAIAEAEADQERTTGAGLP